MLKCSNCERGIGNLENPCVFRDHMVCAECHARLSADAADSPACASEGPLPPQPAALGGAAAAETVTVTAAPMPVTYVTGPWDIKANTPSLICCKQNDLTLTVGVLKKQAFTLPYEYIKTLSVSTVESLPHVTVTRVMATGVFALLWKKKTRDKFLTIKIVDDTSTDLELVLAKSLAGPKMESVQSRVIAARHGYLRRHGAGKNP